MSGPNLKYTTKWTWGEIQWTCEYTYSANNKKSCVTFLIFMILTKNHQNAKFNENVITFTVYPKKYAHGFCFAVLCCGYTLTDFPISIRLTSLALWQSNDCPSASKATLMNMDKYFMWINYERLHNHNKAKHNKTVWIFLGIYCSHQTLHFGKVWEWCHITLIERALGIKIWKLWGLTTFVPRTVFQWEPNDSLLTKIN